MIAANHTEVLVIGAGPAGMAAAMAAAERGCKVTVLDDNLSPGGQIWRGSTVLDQTDHRARHAKADRQKQRAFDRLHAARATVLSARRVFSVHGNGMVQALHESASSTTVEEFHFAQLILATGARERFLPFPGWTLPGVFGPGGLQALVRGGYSVRGKRIVVAGTGPLLLAVAAHLREAGATIVTIAEQAPLRRLVLFGASLWGHPGKLLQGLRYRRQLRKAPFRTGVWVTAAIPTADGQHVQQVRLTDGKREWQESCDLLACGYHLVPNTELASLLGCELQNGFVKVDAEQRTSRPNVFCVGEPTGIAGLDAALAQGEVAGQVCAGALTARAKRRRDAERVFGERLDVAFRLRDELRHLPTPETVVCRCEDVPFHRISQARTWTDSKLQTRCGMGACQGRICGPAVEFLLGWKPVSVREPLFPVPLQAFCSPEISSQPIKEKA